VTGEGLKKRSASTKKAIVVAKRDSWKTLCESTESAPETFSLHRILSRETNAHLEAS
jgi:hypothetical protein